LEGLNLDLDLLINKSFVCKKCFAAYKSFVEKGHQLYDSAAGSVRVLCAANLSEYCTSDNANHDDDDDDCISVSDESARKNRNKRRSNLCFPGGQSKKWKSSSVDSPPVEVSTVKSTHSLFFHLHDE
jgi:hypothetical protein